MLTLKRKYKDDKTLGVITLPDGYQIKTLELKWNNNKVGESCIPEGTYIISRDKTGRHQWFRVNNVPGRTFIEMHEATKTSHLQGCIGMSTEDLQHLVDLFGENDWALKIVNSKGL